MNLPSTELDPRDFHDRSSAHDLDRQRVALRSDNASDEETIVRFIDAGDCSVLELETSNRSGFIQSVSHALFEHSIDIVKAEVRKVAGRVLDRFVITERDGSPIGPARRLALQVAVLSAVDAASC